VNKLFFREFGAEQRRAPAHMPHFINKNVMAELQARWPKEYDATSSHRFRHGKDMQFSFAYYYYLMNKKLDYDPKECFEQMIDLDDDGQVDEGELRYLSLLLNGGRRVSDIELSKLAFELVNASREAGQDGVVNFEAILADKALQKKLKEIVTKKKKYKHEQTNLDQVDFYMVGDNYTLVQRRLDEIRTTGHKFICLNDDMNKTHAPDPRLLKALRDFYLSYFPTPSPFELPEGQVNEFLHMDEYLAAQASWWRFFHRLPFFAWIGLFLLGFLLFFLCTSQLKQTLLSTATRTMIALSSNGEKKAPEGRRKSLGKDKVPRRFLMV